MPNWKDFLDPDAPSGRYLRWKEVEPSAGISRTTAWRLQRAGDFPRPYVISPGRVGYLEAEVDAWRASRGHRRVDAATAASRPAAATPARPASPPDTSPLRPSPGRSGAGLARSPGPKRRPARSRAAAAQAQMQLDL